MSDSHSILAFDKNNGQKLYETPVPLNVFSSATINDSAAYFGSLDGAIYKLEVGRGNVSKIFQVPLSKKNYSAFFESSGKLRADIHEKYSTDITPLYTELLKLGSIFSTIWVDKGLLYFGSADGYIYAIE